MKKVILALALVVMMAGSSWAWTYVPDYGETGWKSFSFSTDLGTGNWDTATLTFGVNDFGDTGYNSVLLVDNVKVTCDFGGYYVHYSNSFESGLNMTVGSGYGTAAVVSSATAASGTVYSPTDGTSMAKIVATQDITSNPFDIHGDDTGFGPTMISFDWNFLAMDYLPFEDYSWAKLTLNDGSEQIFELGKIGTAPVPEPATMLLLGFGLAGLGVLRKVKR